MDRPVKVHVEWQNIRFQATVEGLGTVRDLKEAIFKSTGVQPSLQKLNFDCKESLSDDFRLENLNLKKDSLVVVTSTPEEPEPRTSAGGGDATTVSMQRKLTELNLKKSPECRDRIKILNEPRNGKHLLVIDIDETIFDHRALTTSVNRHASRPFLHQFLSSMYEYYDLAFWSATNMNSIAYKLHMLGITRHASYKTMFYMGKEAMVLTSIPRPKTVKSLYIIWKKFSQYNRTNTIIVEDLKNNFFLNKGNGLCVESYSYTNYENDRELEVLAKYLQLVAASPDFSLIDHTKWKESVV